MAHVTERVLIELERLSDGTKVYFARDLDNEGLMAHGHSVEAAAASLDEARAMRAAHVARSAAGAPAPARGRAWISAIDFSSNESASPPLATAYVVHAR